MWLPFDLHPEYPPEGISLADLHRRYGFGDQDPLRERFAAAGLEYNRPEIVPNTKLALRMTELARERGFHKPFHDRLMDAYWSDATNIGDHLLDVVGVQANRGCEPTELIRLADVRRLRPIGVHQPVMKGFVKAALARQLCHP